MPNPTLPWLNSHRCPGSLVGGSFSCSCKSVRELQQRWPCRAERLPSIALSGGGTNVLVGLLSGELNLLLLLLLELQDAHSDIRYCKWPSDTFFPMSNTDELGEAEHFRVLFPYFYFCEAFRKWAVSPEALAAGWAQQTWPKSSVVTWGPEAGSDCVGLSSLKCACNSLISFTVEVLWCLCINIHIWVCGFKGLGEFDKYSNKYWVTLCFSW